LTTLHEGETGHETLLSERTAVRGVPKYREKYWYFSPECNRERLDGVHFLAARRWV
jgi:hypothetical protein